VPSKVSAVLSARRAVRIESRTNLLFSFEKMPLRDAVREGNGARTFATELFELPAGHPNTTERPRPPGSPLGP
jgi:hypothetical protein